MLNPKLLRSKMVLAGTSQRELAKKAGMSENSFSRKMNGLSFFDTQQIDLICAELKINDDREKVDIFLSQSSQNRDIQTNKTHAAG